MCTTGLCRQALPIKRPHPCPPIGPPLAVGAAASPFDSSRLSMARCPDGAPAAGTRALHEEVQRVAVLMHADPQGRRRPVQAEMDGVVAGSVRRPR